MSLPLQSVMMPPLPHPSLDEPDSAHKDMPRPLDGSPPGDVSDTQRGVVTPVVGVASKKELVKAESMSDNQMETGATLKKKLSQSLDNIRDAIAKLGTD